MSRVTTMATAASAAVQNTPRTGFESNGTIFGRILRGELPAKVVYEDDLLLGFLDISPASALHALIIPKEQVVRTASDLNPAHAELVRHMASVAEDVARANGVMEPTKAKVSGELGVGFHLWPLISVNHLHLHVIHPLPAASFWHRMLFPQHFGSVFVSADGVLERLQRIES